MDLSTPLSALSGIGNSFAKKLERLGLFTVADLLHHYPFRYDDFSENRTIDQTKIGETVTFKGEIWSIKNTYTRSRRILTQAVLNDSTGTVEIVWFNQPWLTKNIHPGDKIQVSGKLNRKGSKINLVSPDWEKISEFTVNPLHTGRLVPVYPETYGVSSKWLRQKIAHIFPITMPHIDDPIPEEIRGQRFTLREALEAIHLPKDFEQAKLARDRLAFDELFYIQLATLKQRAEWEKRKAVTPLNIDKDKLEAFTAQLPFELTKAQKRVIGEIILDLQSITPMNRLVQGDVGSGKTIVAAAIAFLVHDNNLRTIFMAPTEILAFQHFETLSKLLTPYGIEVGIYTGSRKRAEGNIIVGTHALLSTKLELENVGLIIVDEQQRFGVEQRSLLRHRHNIPHFLTMTATPIPRTVALTLYGDLDLSIIDEQPKGRKIVRTHFVPKQKRGDAYKFIEGKVAEGQQVYIVTPLIEESETLASAKAAKVEFERLKKDVFPKLKLGLLHGKLSSKDKERVITDFKNHDIDILVSTSVVEVGVDVPNATIMVIEGAERFGLAGLHQLRGRVGRGMEQSFTFLFTEQEIPGIVSRLREFENIHDGLKLSELDLKIRGSGEIFGTKQSGRWEMKIASLSDLKLIEETRGAAQKLLVRDPDLDKYPQIRRKLCVSATNTMPD